ncbi:MAG: nucleotidyl transferase AbiEii/AbiGii toxin family protein [Anaerolineaceae bacterium]|jgi:predicted nucleotidyltransferase component of viral defense system
MSGIKNLPESVRQRLLNKAHATNRLFNEILQYFAIERFLYRISRSNYSDKFILKGALMFLAWGASIYRPTRDIDFLGFTTNELEAVAKIIQEISVQEVEEDGLAFDPSSVQSERIKEDADYEGVRVKLTGYLGEAKIPLQIDIGFADVVSPAPIMLKYPTILQMPAPHLRGYPPESVVAEKFHAIVFLGSVNSRMKDFYDLWVLAEQFEFDGQTLQKAIVNTFQRRNTTLPRETPVGLSNSFAAENQTQWKSFVKRIHLEDVPESLSVISQVLNRILIPPIHASASGELFKSIWKPGGPWNL